MDGFKHDYVKVYGYKTQVDKNISEWDRKIKQILKNMHDDIESYKDNTEKYSEHKRDEDYYANMSWGSWRRIGYEYANTNKKYYGMKRYHDKKNAVEKHETINIIKEYIRILQKATNAISGLSAKIVSAEQKTTVQLGKLDKIILDMSDKAEKKDDNEI